MWYQDNKKYEIPYYKICKHKMNYSNQLLCCPKFVHFLEIFFINKESNFFKQEINNLSYRWQMVIDVHGNYCIKYIFLNTNLFLISNL